MNEIAVIIPTIGTNGFIFNLVNQLHEQHDMNQILVLNNSGDPVIDLLALEYNFNWVKVLPTMAMNIYQQWNYGIKKISHFCDIAVILNDDIILDIDWFVTRLIEPIISDADVWFSSANWDHRDFDESWKHFPGTRKDNGLCGFAFAVPVKPFVDGDLKFEEGYEIWHGDDDILHQITKADKKAVMAKDAIITHINGGSNSYGDRCKYVNDENAKDTKLYYRKWHNG